MRLRLFCDRNLVPAGCQHVALLDPFWGMERYDPEGNFRQSAAGYLTEASKLFALVPSLGDADAALLPVDWSELLGNPPALASAQGFLHQAAQAGRKVIVFFCHDAPIQIAWPANAVVLRIAIQRRLRKPAEFIIPQWSKDYLADERRGELTIRPKTTVPTVGFCGYAPPLGLRPGKRWFKESARLAAHYLGLGRLIPSRAAHAARTRALLVLKRSRAVKCSFLIRGESAFDNQYGAFLPGGTVEAAAIRRRDFAANIVESDYVLCSRGWANCSIRFYETLCLGRIPILIDTDIVLPFASQIDWQRHCILVPERKLPQVAAMVREFHDKLSESAFEERQRACRRLYEEWLSPYGFFRNLHRCLS